MKNENIKDVPNKEFFKYIFKRIDTRLFLFITIIFTPIIIICNLEEAHDYWNKADKLALFIQIIMTLFLILLWLANIKQVWTNELNNFLNINLYYEGKKQAYIELVPLVEVSDIRSQTQAMLKAINQGEPLSLSPYVNISGRNKTHIDDSKKVNSGEPFELYTVTINLTKSLSEHKIGKAIENENNSFKNYRVEWTHPFEEKDKKVINKDEKGEEKEGIFPKQNTT